MSEDACSCLAIPRLISGGVVANPVSAGGLSLILPSFARKLHNLDGNIHLNRLLSPLFLKLVQIPTQHVVKKQVKE